MFKISIFFYNVTFFDNKRFYTRQIKKMSRKELEDMIRDRKEDLEHIKQKLQSDRVLEGEDNEFDRLWRRKNQLEVEIVKLEKDLATFEI